MQLQSDEVCVSGEIHCNPGSFTMPIRITGNNHTQECTNFFIICLLPHFHWLDCSQQVFHCKDVSVVHNRSKQFNSEKQFQIIERHRMVWKFVFWSSFLMEFWCCDFTCVSIPWNFIQISIEWIKSSPSSKSLTIYFPLELAALSQFQLH